MKAFEFTVQSRIGIHARPAAYLCKKAKEYESRITIYHGIKKANVKKIMDLMALGVAYQEKVRIEIEGSDEAVAYRELRAYCKENI